MNEEQRKRYEDERKMAQKIRYDLSGKYKVSNCKFDPTAVEVRDITHEQYDQLCRELHCSGTYSEKYHTGIILNFGKYN